MDSGLAKDLFGKYSAAVAYVEVEDASGDRHIGSAFHVGEGVFVTARHVLEGYTVIEVGMTERTYVELTGEAADESRTFVQVDDKRLPVHRVENGIMNIASGPHFHRHERVDVAVFKVEEIDPYTPTIRLGDHLDDWLGSSDFTLTEAIILGYPPVPMSTGPVLIGARAEVNAQIDLYDIPHVHFILSAMPRGGFSGGVAISERDMALGVVTRSLLAGDHPAELGFMTVVSVEPIYNCLADFKLLPDCQAEGWDEFWNTSTLWFTHPHESENKLEESGETGATIKAEDAEAAMQFDIPGNVSHIVASLQLFDDGKRAALIVECRDDDRLQQALFMLVEIQLSDYDLVQSIAPTGRRFDIQNWDTLAGERALAAARAVSARLVQSGYVPQPGPPGGEDLL